MKVNAILRGPALLIALVFAITACQAGASPTPATPEPTGPAPTDDATPEPTEAPQEATEFTVAFTSIGLSSLPLIAAIDELRAQGYTIDTPELAESELVTEGVAQGRFQFGSGANNSSLVAMAAGANIKWIVDRVSNEWTVYAREGIDTCEALVASRVAIHSPGSVSGAMLRDWVNNACSAEGVAAYEPLIIEGSQNRLAALLADQIDASPVEYGDALILEAEGGFRRVVSFAQDLPELHPTSVYGNVEFIEANPGVTRALIRELLLQHRRINSEDGYLFSLLQRYLPEEAADEEQARSITAAYVEARQFDNNGGLTEDAVVYTIGFFGPNGTGAIDEELSPDQVADLSYLEAVLDEVGRE